MTQPETRRQSITFTSLLAFLLGGISGCFFVILICCVILLSGCSALGISTRNNSDGKESCVVIRKPSALRVCWIAPPLPEDSLE
jgi:hypothetical protein